MRQRQTPALPHYAARVILRGLKPVKANFGRAARLGLFGICLAGPAFGQTTTAGAQPDPTLKPLVAPPAEEHHVGKMLIAELATHDLAATKAFYGGLLGWTFQDFMFGSTSVAEAFAVGQPVAVLIQRPVPPAAATAGAQMQPAWVSFFAVRDVEAAKNLAVQGGAKLLFGPHPLPGLGQQAVLTDPQGAVFGFIASSSGDPKDEPAQAGQWIWSSLFAADPDTDSTFYQSVLGYDVYDMPGKGDARHFIIASDGFARASANPMPEGNAAMRPHWLNFVRSDDMPAMAAKVASLGGRVLVQPQKDRHGARIAVVADPMGVPFGLMEWPYSNKPGLAK